MMINMKLKILLISAALLLSTNSVYANVGKIIYGYGNNYALDNDGNRRDLKREDVIQEGDTQVTGKGRIHVRLIDGGFVSVYPNSEYRIDKFKFSGKKTRQQSTAAVKTKNTKPTSESKDDRGFFSLLKGAARQVTGLLGRTYNNNFKFKTSVATIGIRGTGFFAKLCQADCFDADGNPIPDGMYVKNNTGVITMTTNAGEVVLAQGQSAHAVSSEDSPRQIDQPPIAYHLVAPDIELYDFDGKVTGIAGVEVVDPGTDPGVEPPVAATITPTKVDYVLTGSTSSGFVNSLDTSNPLDSTQQNGDVIERFQTSFPGDAIPIPVLFDKAGATLAESGSDTDFGILWARWNGGFTYTENDSPIVLFDDNIHIIGAEQLTQNVASLGSKGVVQYTGTGGTNPTMLTSFGSELVGTQTVTIDLDFAGVTSGLVFVNGFSVQANFGAAADLTITSSPSSISGNSGEFSIQATCSGLECGGTTVFLDGSTTINLVGDQAQGVFGAYNLGGSGNAVSGSYVATESAILN